MSDELPELRRVHLKEGQFLPPAFTLRGVSHPCGRFILTFRLTLELPTGTPETYWRTLGGHVDVHYTEDFPVNPGDILGLGTGLRVGGTKLPDRKTDWENVRGEITHAFYDYTDELDAVLRVMQEFASKVTFQPAGTELVETWEFVSIADYYKFALTLVNAACLRGRETFNAAQILAACSAWWDQLEQEEPLVAETATQHRAVIAELRTAKLSV